MTRSAIDHTASNDGKQCMDWKGCGSRWSFTHLELCISIYLRGRRKFMTTFVRTNDSWPRFAPNTCPRKAGSSTAWDSLLVLCILFSGRQTSSVYGKRYSCTCVYKAQGHKGVRGSDSILHIVIRTNSYCVCSHACTANSGPSNPTGGLGEMLGRPTGRLFRSALYSTAFSKYAILESHKAHTEPKQCISIKTTHCIILVLNNQINPK